MENTVIYLRKSRVGEENNGLEDALENHKRILEKLCKSKGWKYEILEEIASSQSISARPEMSKLISWIEEGKVTRVVCMDVDRLSRENYDLAFLRKLFIKNNIELVTPQKTFDWNNESDVMLFGFHSIIGENEYRQIRKRMLLGKQICAEQGKWVNGKPPLGYRRDKNTGKIELVEEEVKLVRYIVECYLSGEYNNHTLARHLNELGYIGRRGASWDASRLYRLMNNRAYLGEVKYKDKWYKGQHKALISKEEWEELHQQLKGNRVISPRTTKQTKKKLSGLCKCGLCGRTMTVIVDYKRGKNFVKCWYKNPTTLKRCCNRSVQEQVIIKHLESYLQQYIDNLENINSDASIDNEVTKLKNRIAEIDKIIEKENTKRKNTIKMGQEGILELSEVKLEVDKIKKNIAEKESEKIVIEKQIISLSRDVKDRIMKLKEGYVKILKSSNDEDYNSALREIVNNIKITRIKDEIDIDVTFI
ncbi:TPA: recombinase family protein [Clostridium perfringens]|nr:recombinase family protein [Clostridium perfringens]